MSFDVEKLRQEFPILQRQVHGKPLIYFDNAASVQKPKEVLKAIQSYYSDVNANVHRGIHTLSQEATQLMEDSREKLRAFINAEKVYEVLFVRGTTEGNNLVAHGISPLIEQGDEIIISQMEHHSNIVPWQMLCERTGAVLKYIPMLPDGSLDMDAYDSLLSDRTKMVTAVYVSNALGVINPIKEIIDKAHSYGAWVLIDAAQSIAHLKTDVQELDVDFLTFSGHKMYGPTGSGVLYGKENILEKMQPYMGGGEMIKEVSLEKTTYAELPFKFEAGTPNIEANIVIGDAVDFIFKYGLDNFREHEKELLSYCLNKLSEIEGLEIYAKDTPRSGAISFNLKIEGAHPSDVGFILDKQGIAVRTGHHCTQPIMKFFGIPGTVRASFACYNTKEEIDVFIESLKKTYTILSS